MKKEDVKAIYNVRFFLVFPQVSNSLRLGIPFL